MANINQISPDGGTTVYDIEDPTARSGVNSLTPRVGIAEGKISTLQEQMLSVQDDLDGLGTASTKNSTSVVTESSDLVESGAVFDALGFGTKNLFGAGYSAVDVTDTLRPAAQQRLIATINNPNEIVFRGNNGDYSTAFFEIDGIDGTADYAITYEIKDNNTGYTPTLSIYSDATTSSKLTLMIYARSGSSVLSSDKHFTLYNIQVEKGSTATAYEPYHASVSDSLDDKLSYADNTVLGCKNLSPILFSNVSGTPNALYQLTDSGIRVYTTISDSYQRVYITLDNLPQNTDIKISSDITYVSGIARIGVQGYKNNTWTDITFPEGVKQSGKWVDTFNTGDYSQWKVWLYITALTSEVGDITYGKFMFRLATDTDPTFAPYSKTNVQLTQDKADNSVIAPTENGSTASQAYAVGEHFIRDGAFCTCKQAIPQGGSFTLNTNYTAGDVASDLVYKAGDVIDFTLPAGVFAQVMGSLTNSGTDLWVSFPLYKKIIATNTTLSGIITVRGLDGYILSSVDISTLTIISNYINENFLTYCIRKSDGTAFSSSNSNKPINVAFSGTITFS